MESKQTNIASAIQTLLKDKKAFVFYKKPLASKVNCIVQKKVNINRTKSFDESGFVFAPFNREEEAIFFSDKESQLSYFQLPDLKDVSRKREQSESQNKSDYIALLQKTIAFIENGNADKIVLSRYIDRNYQQESIGTIYESLVLSYPTAFVYIWSHPKVGLWMGATPEKLVEVKGASFSTMSLAGTQLFAENIQWKPKEIIEQKWVTDYIANQLKPLVSNLEITEPFTKKAGHLAHICTELKGELSNKFSIKDLIFYLHPTPAVGGTPRDVATEFILRNENYNREFYTGFLGEINRNSQTDLYVNLRCMQLKNGIAKLYVGGGITKDSVPEKEWEETVAKSAVLGRLLK